MCLPAVRLGVCLIDLTADNQDDISLEIAEEHPQVQQIRSADGIGPSPTLFALPAASAGVEEWPTLESSNFEGVSSPTATAAQRHFAQLDLNRLHLLSDEEKSRKALELLDLMDREDAADTQVDVESEHRVPQINIEPSSASEVTDFPVAFGFEDGVSFEMTNDQFDAMLRFRRMYLYV